MLVSGQQNKLIALQDALRAYDAVAVAYSGGVDSTLLLAVAHEVLGDKAGAFTIDSPFYPQRETQATQLFCHKRGIEQHLVYYNELEDNSIASNPKNRCYFCKRNLFGTLIQEAKKLGIATVVEGSNTDDLHDYRPGRAAIAELGIASPLLDCGLSKQDVRDISHHLGLPTWNKPALACLASRFVYDKPITAEGLRRVEAAEQALLDQGFSNVRVRSNENHARIEVPQKELARFDDAKFSAFVQNTLYDLGFIAVDIDPQGYRMGSMNEEHAS